MKKSRFIRVFAAILSVVMLLQLTLPVGAVDEPLSERVQNQQI